MTDEPDWRARLTLDVAELLDGIDTEQWVHPDHRNPDDAALPRLARTRSSGFRWATRSTGLLNQLRDLRDGQAPAGSSSTGHGQPGSRLPAGADTADLVVEITGGAAHLHWKAMRLLGRTEERARREPGKDIVGLGYARAGFRTVLWCRHQTDVDDVTRRHGMPDWTATANLSGPHAGYTSPDADGSLRALLDLVNQVPAQLRSDICTQVHRWVLAARLALSYSAPMAKLQNPCPCCGQQTLIVRSDASSDVMCVNPECVTEDGQQPRWPRHRWLLVLAGVDPVEETETA